MLDNKKFIIEVQDTTPTDQAGTTTSVKDDVKELVVYTVKAVALLVVATGVTYTVSELLINHLS